MDLHAPLGNGPARRKLIVIVGERSPTMNDLLTATPLCGLQAQRAYALVGLAHPSVTAKQWATFVSRYARSPRQRRGLIGIQDGRGYVHGVFCYAVDRPSL